MYDSKDYFLSAAIKLNESDSAIAIPIFSAYPSNIYYIPSTTKGLIITAFQELDGFDELIRGFDEVIPLKCQFEIGDISPVIVWDRGRILIFDGETLNFLLDKVLLQQPSGGPILDELIRDLNAILEHSSEESYENEDDFEDDGIEPTGAKLWLDQAIDALRLRGFSSLPKKGAEENELRLALFAWAQDVSASVTSPIFNHFLWTLRKCSDAGLYTDDIMGAAVLKRASSNIAGREKITDAVLDFRRKYGRGPLRCVKELASGPPGPAQRRARQALESFYEVILDALARGSPYEILLTTFVADDPTDWPSRVRSELDDLLNRTIDAINGLREQRQQIFFHLNAISNMPGKENSYMGRDAVLYKTELLNKDRDAQILIRNNVDVLDALYKCLDRSKKYLEPFRRFSSPNYSNLGYHTDIFVEMSIS